MKRREKPAYREIFARFSRVIGKETLNVRVFREKTGFVCERELVENDGTTFTQALPFVKLGKLKRFLLADPHYPLYRKEAEKLIEALAVEVMNGNTSVS
jgi:hypothetical protein